MKKRGKKRLAAILSLCMMLTLLPAAALAAGGEYNLVVAGVNVTSANADDILGDGKVSYNPDTKALTLNNAVLNSGIYRSFIKEGDDLTVNIIGENTINITSTYGISLGANALYLQGGGKLNIIQAGNLLQQGIWAKKITIDGVGLTIHSGADCIYSEANYGVAVEDGDETVTVINGAVLDLISDQYAPISAREISIDGSTVTARTKAESHHALYAWEGSIKINNSTVEAYAESSASPAVWAADTVEITGGSDVTATGGSSNTIYCDGDIVVNNSTVKAYDTSTYAYPAIYAYGDITVENSSTVTAESKGMRGIFTDGNMTINDSTVTASGTKNEGMVAIKGLKVNNSKLTASCSPGGSYIWAIVTGMLEVTASEITAYGGIDISDYYTLSRDNASFRITPAAGTLAELKTDAANHDGYAAVHFGQSPYSAAADFDADAMAALSSCKYVHIGEHVHAGGTATCTAEAVCEDCGRPYGDVDPDNHSFTNYKYNNDATCTADGTETAKCDRCGAADTREKAGTILKHKAVKIEAKDATCTGDGNIEYWRCETCGRYFSDEALTQQITEEATVIEAKGHGETELKNEKEATCTAEGYTGDRVCRDCGEVLQKGQTVAKLAHSYKDGTCTVCGASDPDYKPGGQNDNDSPQTDDNAMLWISLITASGCAAAAFAVYIKRKSC